MADTPRLLETPPDWTPEERPTLPGSPPSLSHSRTTHFFYLVIGVFISITGGLGTGIITANLPQIQGEYGLTPAEAAWIPAAYVMANISANLILFKARQQYGLRKFTELALLGFMLVILLHIFVQHYAMAVFVRAVSGFMAAPLGSLGMYYVMQAFGPKHRLRGLYIGFGFSQLGLPLAWMISPYLLNVNNWTTLYTFELGLAICCYAMVVSLKLPRSLRIAVFEKEDFYTFLLLAPGFAFLCAALVQGPIVWWFNSPMIAWFLIAGLACMLLGFAYEHHRRNPLIMTRWLGTWSIIRFIIGALCIRLLMSEQSYAVVNFLKTMGMGQDQFSGLYTVIFFGILLGSLFSALTFARERVVAQLVFAVLLILLASRLDAHLSSDVRPENFYPSQFLISFASGLFIGPLLLRGFGQALQQGPNYVVTFIVLFSATQSFGGLIGSSFYTTFQQQRSQLYQQDIARSLEPDNLLVAQRLQQYQASIKPVLGDTQLQQQQAVQSLNQVISREAQVRAYNDVISLNSLLAVFLLVWSFANIAWDKYREQRQHLQ